MATPKAKAAAAAIAKKAAKKVAKKAPAKKVAKKAPAKEVKKLTAKQLKAKSIYAAKYYEKNHTSILAKQKKRRQRCAKALGGK